MRRIVSFTGLAVALFGAALVVVGISNQVLDRPIAMPADAQEGKTPAFARARKVFEADCLACHSSRTNLPWYANLPLAKQLIQADIREARKEMDFEKRIYAPGKRPSVHTLKEIRKEIRKNAMPPPVYKVVHWRSFLSSDDRAAVLNWVEEELGAYAASPPV